MAYALVLKTINSIPADTRRGVDVALKMGKLRERLVNIKAILPSLWCLLVYCTTPNSEILLLYERAHLSHIITMHHTSHGFIRPLGYFFFVIQLTPLLE